MHPTDRTPETPEDIQEVRAKAEEVVKLMVDLDPNREGIGTNEDIIRFIKEARYAKFIIMMAINFLSHMSGDRKEYWDDISHMIDTAKNHLDIIDGDDEHSLMLH